ncbi:MAG: c-type cytochrome [Flavisolibacter sp.]
MIKPAIAILLLLAFAGYSAAVYTSGTESNVNWPAEKMQRSLRGKTLYQQYNCQSCHQIFGLGGYLGPDLTTAWSDTRRGPVYLKALLQSGGARMPNFDFSEVQINDIITYLEYVDQTATPLQKQE